MKFTVSDFVAVLTTRSKNLVRVESVSDAMAAKLGKEIKDLHKANRTLEDIARIGDFVAEGHLRSFPGGSPNLPWFAVTGQIEGLIVQTSDWDRAGRPLPEVWRRNRLAKGYQIAPTNEEFNSDPILQTAKRSDAGYYEIDPWGSPNKASDGKAVSGNEK
jgi:hypothetical protein